MIEPITAEKVYGKAMLALAQSEGKIGKLPRKVVDPRGFEITKDIIEILRGNRMTLRQIRDALNETSSEKLSYLFVRERVAYAMCRDGLVEKCGRRENAVIWRLTEKGAAAHGKGVE